MRRWWCTLLCFGCGRIAFEANAGSPHDALHTDVGDTSATCVTWDPAAKGASISLSNADLDASSSTPRGMVVATHALTASTGQRAYFELLIVTADNNAEVGIKDEDVSNLDDYHGDLASGNVFYDNNTSTLRASGTWTVAIAASQANFATGDVVMWALDRSAGQIWQGRNGTWLGAGDPVRAINPTFKADAAASWFPSAAPTFPAVFRILASSDDFRHAPPTGFPSLGAAVGVGDGPCAP